MFLDDAKERVIGIDEVGRGAFSGPVVSCCVLLSRDILNYNTVNEIDDSKRLSEKKRIRLSKFIKENSVYSIGIASNEEIDKINILQATNLSIKRAYQKFTKFKNFVKIDGNKTFYLNDKTTFLKQGDRRSVSIASASIIAKIWRDELMCLYSKLYPQYSWEKNKGYGTKSHREAIKIYGLTKIHRKTFIK